MTRKKLSQAYKLNREKEMWERKLRELLESSNVKSPSNQNGQNGSRGISDRTADEAIKIIEKVEIVEALKLNVETQINEIDEYIASIDDTFLRQIIQYRCVKMMSWGKVARMIGAGTSAESCRKYYERKIPKE